MDHELEFEYFSCRYKVNLNTDKVLFYSIYEHNWLVAGNFSYFKKMGEDKFSDYHIWYEIYKQAAPKHPMEVF